MSIHNMHKMILLAVFSVILTIAGCSGSPAEEPEAYDDQSIESFISRQISMQPATAASSGRIVPMQILAINDFHGQIDSGRFVSGRAAGSAPVLASYLKDAAKDKEDCTVFVSAGDMIGASMPVSALLQDEPTISFFNMLGNRTAQKKNAFSPFNNLVAVTGNHELDEGTDELWRLLVGGNHVNGPFLENPYRGANFPIICANIVYKNTQYPYYCPLVIKMIKGVPVAFIGATLKETPSIVTASGIQDISFEDEAASINRYVKILKRFGIRSIAAVIHQGAAMSGYTGDTDPSRKQPTGDLMNIIRVLDDEVDVVIGAHSHGFCNALVPNANGKQILVTQAYSYGTAYADIDLELDVKTRDVSSKKAMIVTTWADSGPGLFPDADAAQLVSKARTLTDPKTSEVIGTAVNAITSAQNSAGESMLGNLIADAQRTAMGTDFAFMNPGGIRSNLAAGIITWGALYTVQPFTNYCVTMELTGDQIYTLLNQQWAGQTYARMLQISGLCYSWDAARPVDDRVVRIWTASGDLNRTAVYTVTVNSFLSDGGDNFIILKSGANKAVGMTDLEALIQYIKTATPVTGMIDERIIKL